MGLDEIIEKSTTSKIVEALTRTIALGALVVTLILVIDRAAICSFYHISITYSSLDLVSVIPVIVILYPVIIIMGVFGTWIYYIFSEIKKDIIMGISMMKNINNKQTEKDDEHGNRNKKT